MMLLLSESSSAAQLGSAVLEFEYDTRRYLVSAIVCPHRSSARPGDTQIDAALRFKRDRARIVQSSAGTGSTCGTRQKAFVMPYHQVTDTLALLKSK